MSEAEWTYGESNYWTKSNTLRFVVRDGKHILQYLQTRVYANKEENVWIDVPVAEETKEDSKT